MRCPFCAAQDTKVIDSRLASEGAQVRRRRECEGCGERFTTYETAELALPHVIKHDGRREAFKEAKLRNGITLALEKRPVATEQVEAIISRIKHQAQGEREISSRQLGEWVMAALRQIDQVAYVRFASVYRSFEDVQAFRDLIERLEQDMPVEMAKLQMPLIRDEPD